MTSVAWNLYPAEQIQRNVGLEHQVQIISHGIRGLSVVRSGVLQFPVLSTIVSVALKLMSRLCNQLDDYLE